MEDVICEGRQEVFVLTEYYEILVNDLTSLPAR